jgi:hypothetical protein
MTKPKFDLSCPTHEIEMKTPEKWNDEYRDLCANNPVVHGQLLPNPQNIAFIQQIQRDAWNAGVEAAVEICIKYKNYGDLHPPINTREAILPLKKGDL